VQYQEIFLKKSVFYGIFGLISIIAVLVYEAVKLMIDQIRLAWDVSRDRNRGACEGIRRTNICGLRY